MGKKQVIQFIPSVVWKQVYIDYQMHCPNLIFVEENLKDHLHDNSKEFKIGTSNEEGSKKATLQYDEVLECLRATSGHATKNVL
jgi:hypothetical protein